MTHDYLPRIADARLAQALATSGAVQVKGPKWCGKTETALQQASSVIYLQDPDYSASYLALADAKPSKLLEGATPRLIDEWQMAPQLWDAVRFAVDRRRTSGQFILTGSSTPTVSPAHSGVGRITSFVMRPMTLHESQESSGDVSLAELFDAPGEAIGGISPLDVEDMAQILCRGGWPAAITTGQSNRSPDLARAYIDGLVESDISRIDGVNRNATRVRALMRSYARHISTQASQATMAADLAVNDEAMSPNTVSDYLDALARAYITDELEAWNPALRSKTAVRTSPTRHFVDPSVGTALMRATAANLLHDMEAYGLLFESLCVRDLRVYAEAMDGSLFHYRDKTGLEADAVVVLADGRWAPVEVKLGERQVDEAAANLQKLAERVDTSRMGAPSFLMVVTGGKAAYRRDDGVLVVPLACLRP
ncbi:ATP-binding protein [Corynebacterium lowii]|uniref:Uncharacterized protein n=1 Tax=Corynebacterium lowii TaxID=1544413 RepID=A0A0Q0U4L5_9CORY|nr:DUF4143 domain-containing protein [Corynebacterium lowii]KQB86905.1 hypothetical protein Clow_01116 [Corynebacterium lowii]MDP9851593.1 putative AAA+ superfamily ATPase [Corynebacterium lowii]